MENSEKNSFGDGMITFPGKFSTYGLLATRRRWVPFHYVYAYLYGSTYPADQTILIVPNLDFFSNSISITAESGFQTINAVDVNGDGVDEIVKVNFNGTSGSKTVLKVTVYTLTTGTAYTTRTFNVNVEGGWSTATTIITVLFPEATTLEISEETDRYKW